VKKITAILLALLYTAITSGFTVNLHYCMGKLASVKLASPSEECGKCGKTTTTDGCCKDKQQFCKVTVSHQGAKAQQTPVVSVLALHLPVAVQTVPAVRSITSFIAYYNHAPPDKAGIPLYKRHRAFLI
jgi:hypothetical protein